MKCQKLLPQVISLTLVVLFLTGYGGAQVMLTPTGVAEARCLAPQVATTTPTPEPAAEQVNLLIAPERGGRLKREGWADYVPVAFGTMLHPTDLLRVEGEASVLCADLSVETVTRRGRCPCPAAPGVLEYGGARFDIHLRSATPDVPYILHPRNTLVLDPHPLLRWHDTGASSYTVSIVMSGEMVWSQPEVVGNEIRYPDEALPLQPGADYLLTVRDNDAGRASTEDPTRGLGFQLLGDDVRPAVEAQRDEILALSSLDAPALNLALAVYYAGLEVNGRGLWGEALLLLDEVSAERDSPTVQLRRGELLMAIKLRGEAQDAYRTALESAEALGDLESQAAAHAALWRLTGDEAHREQAMELYEELGDKAQADALREE